MSEDKESLAGSSRKVPKSLKKVVKNVIISNRIRKSFESKVQGVTLENCDLPDHEERLVAEVLQWQTRHRIKIKDEHLKYLDLEETQEENEQVEEEGAKEEGKAVNNPYLYFLDAVEDENDEEHYGGGVLGGLQSWLGFAGSLGGHEMTSMGTNDPANTARRPWLRKQRSGEDGVNKKAEEHMTRIAGEFCTWLRSLPGEDQSVNSMTEQHLRSVLSSYY